MKYRRLRLICLLVFETAAGWPTCKADTTSVNVVAKGGMSFYGSLFVGRFGGNSAGDTHWAPGPMFGLGVEVPATKVFSFQVLLEYSTHKYKYDLWENPINHSRNTILELSGETRISLGLVYFLVGVGISRQQKDGQSLVIASGNFGTGVRVRASGHVGVFLEGTIRMRAYVTPVVQIGATYEIR